MQVSNHHRAEVLVEALPYIRKYNGKVLVIKYGGNAMINEELKQQVMEDLVLLHLIGVKLVLVYGGGPEITEMLGRVGKEAQWVDGLRVTDKETVEIVQMVLAGKINKSLVNLMQTKGGKAVGLSGVDGHMIKCKVKDSRLGYVGEITDVDIKPIEDLLEKHYIPIVSTIGCDEEGNTYNINADTAAAHIAGALKAERLITMTDIPGVMMDPKDPESLIPCIDLQDAAELFEKGIISGGMIPKVQCCIDAIRYGVKKVTILDGRVSHAVLMELLTDEGAGTMVLEDKFSRNEKTARMRPNNG